MRKFFGAALLPFFLLIATCGDNYVEPVDIDWTPWAQVQATFPQSDGQTFLYVTQNNCEWCTQMDSTIFNRPEIAKHLNDNFTNVKINVDEDLPITIQGKEYDYSAFFNLLQIPVIPSYFFFDRNGNVIGMMDSAMPLLTFKQLLVYVRDRHFGMTPWQQFMMMPEAQLDTVWGEF